MFKNLKKVLNSLREIPEKVKEREIDRYLEDLELKLLKCNVAYEVAEVLKENFKNSIKDGENPKNAVERILLEIVSFGNEDLEKMIADKLEKGNSPFLILLLGFNGSGKTTTAGKLAHLLMKYRPVLAAGDTFRAASIEQLEFYARDLNIKIVKQKYGSDPAAVIYDAMEYAKSNNCAVVIADTAGRSYTRKGLMEELRKIVRVNNPDQKILVVDALTGNTAIDQAQSFGEVGFDSIIVSKVDADELGGAILSLAYVSKKPIIYLGVGQKYGDIEKFNPNKFVERILGG